MLPATHGEHAHSHTHSYPPTHSTGWGPPNLRLLARLFPTPGVERKEKGEDRRQAAADPHDYSAKAALAIISKASGEERAGAWGQEGGRGTPGSMEQSSALLFISRNFRGAGSQDQPEKKAEDEGIEKNGQEREREKKRQKERDPRAVEEEKRRGRKGREGRRRAERKRRKGGRKREASRGDPRPRPQAPGSQHVVLCLENSNLYAN